MEDRFFWSGYEWENKERWGRLHPDKPWTWYSPKCVSITDNGELALNIIPDANVFEKGGNYYFPKFGMGLVSSTKNNPIFKFGEYTWVAKMPKGKHLWPALWMWSFDSWPPEIDIAEGWTNDCGGYFKFVKNGKLLQWNIQSNCWYWREDDKSNNPQPIPILKGNWKDPSKKYIKYQFRWYPARLEFLYDGKLVRVIDDVEFLKYLDQHTQEGMNIIMNLHPTKEYNNYETSEPLLIKSFTYRKF